MRGGCRILILTLMLAACAETASTDVPVATDICAAPEFPAVQYGGHLLGDNDPPIAYSSTPPTSGWHASGVIDIRPFSPPETLSGPEQVSILEVGGIVVAYDDLPAADVQQLSDRVDEQFPGQVAVTSVSDLPDGTVAYAGWGVIQRCSGLDVAALDAFVPAYGTEDPAVPGSDATPRNDVPAGGSPR